jgi:AraC-like DNA-binding protein
VPYNWRESSADRTYITKYALGFSLLGILHFSIQVFHLYWLLLVHQLVWISFFLSVTYYELYERLNVPLKPLDAKTGELAGRMEDKLWEQTLILLNSNGKWRSPELSLTSLAEQLESNRTYVGEAFKRNTGRTFVDYITHRRINYVVESLKQNPNANIYELFNYVGYRQRSTAWRNFQKITGFSPTEYVENLK